MNIRVRPDSQVPIYEQIMSQFVFAIAAGDVQPGERILSVRELAAELVVNPNTVVRAYQELERDGMITSKRGMGMEVAADALTICAERRQRIVLTRLREALLEASSAGMSLVEVTTLISNEWPKPL